MLLKSIFFSLLFFSFAFSQIYAATCGNNILEAGEQCDVGANNGVAGSCCSATCQKNTWTASTSTLVWPYGSSTSNGNSYVIPFTLVDYNSAGAIINTSISPTYYTSTYTVGAGTTCSSTISAGNQLSFPIGGVNDALCNEVVTATLNANCGGGTLPITFNTTLQGHCGDGKIDALEACDCSVLYWTKTDTINVSYNYNGVTGSACSSTCGIQSASVSLTVNTAVTVPTSGGSLPFFNTLVSAFTPTTVSAAFLYWNDSSVGLSGACTDEVYQNVRNFTGASIYFPPIITAQTCKLEYAVIGTCTGVVYIANTAPVTFTRPSSCNNSVVDTVAGEKCDLGGSSNGASGSCCTSLCALRGQNCTRTLLTPPVVYDQGATMVISNILMNNFDCNNNPTNTFLKYLDQTATKSPAGSRCTGYSITSPNSITGASVVFAPLTASAYCFIYLDIVSTCSDTDIRATLGFVWFNLTKLCNNSVVDVIAGETCDLGSNNGVTGSCCSSICQTNAFTPTAYTSVNIDNCATNTYPLSSLVPAKTISDTYISTVTYLSNTCTGTSLVGGKTGDISFPALGTPGSCAGTLTYNTTCGIRTNVTSNFIRYCCGDGVATAGPEGCDLGVNNGVAGSCCTSTCQDAAVSFTGPATVYVPACTGTIFTAPVASFFPDINVSSAYWASVVVSFETCTGTVSANLTHVRFNYGSVPVAGTSCGVTLTITTTCGNTIGSGGSGATFYCCGDGTLTTPAEACDRGASNGLDCCTSSCTQVPWTNSANVSFTVPYTTTTVNEAIATIYMPNSNFPSTLWRTSGMTISGTCTNDALSSTNPRTGNVVFSGSPANTLVCTSIVNPLLITACGTVASVPFAATVTETGKCGNGVLDTGESCDLGTNNGVAGSCCTTSCTFASWTIGAPITAQVANCNSGSDLISDWYQSSTVSTTFWSSVSVSSENCTGTVNTQGGVTGTVHFPVAGAGGESCQVTLLATSTCGNTLSSTDTAIRYCCGDSIVTVGSPETCDQGASNGVLGSCCSATCTSVSFTATTPSPVIINNCVGVNQSVSTWFISPSINTTLWSSVSIAAQNCTPAASLIGGVNGVISIPAESSTQTCYISVTATASCGQTNTQSKFITRACCGDSVVSGTEVCDLGANNGVAGYCCSSSCTLNSFTASAPTPTTISNCAATNVSIASWYPSSSVTTSTFASVSITSQNCTPAATIVGNQVQFPTESSPQTCQVTLLATTSCGQTLSQSMAITRYCCGDSIVSASEACDLGANNGVAGYCCSGSCTLNSFTATAPSAVEVLNCNAANLTLASWFVSPSVSSASWASASITAQNCTPAATLLGGVTGSIQFPAESFPQTCYVTTTVITSCGQSLSETRTITRSCCGDSIISGSEVCDLGVNNGGTGSCCASNCQTSSITFTSSTPSTFSPLANCNNATIPYTTWFPSSSISSTYWSSVVVASTTCTGTVVVSGTNILFYAYSSGQTCTVTLTATASCGQTLSKTMTVVRTCCGNGIVEAGESCDGGICCQNTCAFQPSSFTCRTAADTCDVAETCTGSLSTCPPDQYRPSSYYCALSTNDCTSNVTCTGLSITCPTNYVVSGSSCHFDSNWCFADTCNGLGTCVRGTAINYNDGQFCNGVESCNTTTGLIIPGTPPNCDDGNSCTTDSCNNRAASCFNVPIVGTYGQCGTTNLGTCKYGNYSCNGAGPTPVVTCVGNIEPANETCGVTPIDTNCNGLVGDGCPFICTSDANCSVVPRNQCQDVKCNVANLTCYTIDKPVNTSCNDGLTCTINDHCFRGQCVGTQVSCDDNNECTVDHCLEPGGVCHHDPAPLANTPCVNEANLCSTGDTCNNQGDCVAGVITTCPAAPQCQINVCNPSTGLCETENYNGICNDLLDCTTNDACGCGTCSGHPIDCDDNIVCTVDSCSEPGGFCLNDLMTGYCLIQGYCYQRYEQNPYNPCMVCLPESSRVDWTFTTWTNVTCDDMNACTTNDLCHPLSHTCSGTAVTCSASPNQCQTNVCDPSIGHCVLTNVAENTACNDGYYCSVGDKCIHGVCQSGSYRDCSSLDSSCVVGTCDENLNTCVSSFVPDGTACTFSSNVCNGQGSCLAGTCTAGASLTCPTNNQCQVHHCDATLGCVLENPLTHTCSDNNVCTIGDTCAADFTCVPGTTLLNCNDSDGTTADYCSSSTGCHHTTLTNTGSCTVAAGCSTMACHSVACTSSLCVYTPLVDGTGCDNNNVCDGLETCHAGVCIDSSPLRCDDSNPCTTDSCNAITGCVHTPITGAYNDNNPCTTGDHCVSGVLITSPYSCPATTACAKYQCYPDPSNTTNPKCVAIPVNENGPCDDGSQYTLDDVCRKGLCVGQPKLCRPPKECESMVVLDISGNCVPLFEITGTPCDVDNLCSNSQCDGAGHCNVVSAAVTCTPIDQCHTAGVCIPSVGVCTTPKKADGTACNDGNACTQTDTCRAGHCFGDNPKVCQRLDQCHLAGECDTVTGLCSNPNAPDGTFCEDSNVCTAAEQCVSGVCTSCGAMNCSTTNPCLIASCNPLTGCEYTYNDGAPCDDGSNCTTGTYCVSGQCPSSTGTFVTCPQTNLCGATMCAHDSGCTESYADACGFCLTSSDCAYLPCHKEHCNTTSQKCYYTHDNAQIIGCVDSIYCNGQETCSGGTCVSGIPPTCDDSQVCTYDYCNTTIDACTHTPIVNNTCFNDNQCIIASKCSVGGTCDAVQTVDCAPAPVCHFALGCNPASGECEYDRYPNGTACDDNDPCTTNDQCHSGDCIGTTPVTCPSANPCIQHGECHKVAGGCVYYNEPDGTPCDDGSACTVDDQCLNGACTSSFTNACTELVPTDLQCQYAACSGSSCTILNHTDGTTCFSGQPYGPCSVAQDVCATGRCTRAYQVGLLCRAADSSGCDLADHCIAGNDFCPDTKKNNGTSCPSVNSCNYNTCYQGTCLTTSSVDCSYLNDNTHSGVCNVSTGTCIQVVLPDGTPCTTGNPITQCVQFEAILDGVCTTFYKPSTAACIDSNPCTHLSFCSGIDATCVTMDPDICTSFDTQCTVGTCNTSSGLCYGAPLANGTACNADNDLCSANDHCVLGVCVVGTPVDCTPYQTACQTATCVAGVCDITVTNITCLQEFCVGGCTYMKAYWATHNRYCAYCNVDKIFIPWPGNSETNILCGRTYYQWLIQLDKGYAFRKLAGQWISTFLNILNGACLPFPVQVAYNNASALLSQCRTQVPVYSLEATAYKNLYNILLEYNNGGTGPGSCSTEWCTNQTIYNTSTCPPRIDAFYRTVIRSVRDEDDDQMAGFLEDTSTADIDCINGIPNFASGECYCNYGWSGRLCDECAINPNSDHMYACVHSHDKYLNKYILRSIPIEQKEYYFSHPDYPAVLPGVNGLDCFCQPVDGILPQWMRPTQPVFQHNRKHFQHNMVRAPEIEIWNGDEDISLVAHIIELETELGSCEAQWVVPSNASDTNLTVFVQVNPHEQEITKWNIAVYVLASVLVMVIAFAIHCWSRYFVLPRKISYQ